MLKVEIIGAHDSCGADGKPTRRAHLRVHCGKSQSGYCDVPCRTDGPVKWDAGHVWGWNGNETSPTITPSINCCRGPTSCGLHFTVTNGAVTQS